MNKTHLSHTKIIETLCQAGFPTFLVGGAVRDIFAGHDPHDFDITTQATPEQIKEAFPNERIQFGVGKSFGVTLVGNVEVATFRVDRYPNGNGAKNCVVKYADTIHEDLSRRDLTVNALALCSLTGELIYNHSGLEDLRNSVIRFVGNADDRIIEDPKRIIRACRFVAKLHGTFTIDTLEAIKRNIHLIKDKNKVPAEFIGSEILRAMELKTPSLFFSALQVTGALPLVFPGMEDCVAYEHGKWHLENVWEHSMLCGDKVSSKFPVLRLAAFLHDVGKPTAFIKQNNGTFVNHEEIGVDIVDTWLSALKFANHDKAKILGVIRSHMWLGDGNTSKKAIRKFLFRINELGVTPQEWLRIRIADTHANLYFDDLTFSKIRDHANKIGIGRTQSEETPFTVNSLALKGGQLIDIFNLSKGPLVSSLQKHLLNFVIENGSDCNTELILKKEASLFFNK